MYKDSFGILNIKAKKLPSWFSGLTVFHGQIIIGILKLSSKAAKLRSTLSFDTSPENIKPLFIFRQKDEVTE